MPLGNVTSKIFANIYLYEVDRVFKHVIRVKRYLRYNDDVLMIVRGKERVVHMRNALHEKMGSCGLKIKTRVRPLLRDTRFDWLGAEHLFRGRTVRYDTRRRIRRAFYRKRHRYEQRRITEKSFRESFISYQAHHQAHVTNA